MPSSSQLLKKAYRTRKGAFGSKSKKAGVGPQSGNALSSSKAKAVQLLASGFASRQSIDVGQSDGKPKTLFGMPVVYGLTESQQRRLMKQAKRPSGRRCSVVHGYKLTRAGGVATRGVQYKPNKVYKHEGNVEMCSSGFHYSTSPLQ